MLEMLELSSRPASSAKLDCRRAAMRVGEASTTNAGPLSLADLTPSEQLLSEPSL